MADIKAQNANIIQANEQYGAEMAILYESLVMEQGLSDTANAQYIALKNEHEKFVNEYEQLQKNVNSTMQDLELGSVKEEIKCRDRRIERQDHREIEYLKKCFGVVFHEFDDLLGKGQMQSGGPPKTQIQMEHSAKGEIIKNNGNTIVAGRYSDTTSLKTTVLASDLKELRDKCNNMFLIAVTPGFHDNPSKVSDQMLKLQRRILGPEHPDTLRAMHTVAV